MRELLARLWHDDDGAVVSIELLLIVSILIFGLIPGLVAMRNSVNSALTTLGNLIVALVPSFTFSGFAINGTDGMGNAITILQIGGIQFTPNMGALLTADQVAPVTLPTEVFVPPAP